MRFRAGPAFWSGLFMVLALAMGLSAAARQKVFVEEQGIPSPNVSAPPAILYFLGVVAVLAFILFLVPARKLRWVFRGLFTLMYGWGVFVFLWLVLPSGNDYLVYGAAAAAALAWLFWARIWVHNLLLLVTLAAGGSVFGFFFSPLTFLVIMFIVSLYDLLAVRYGFMVWMADKMSEATTLPAFVFPREPADWNTSVHSVRVGQLATRPAEGREYSILGGGDIAFPLMLVVSVFFKAHLLGALVVGAFAVAGLAVVFVIQAVFLKGKPVPALPPIAAASLAGFLVARLLPT